VNAEGSVAQLVATVSQDLKAPLGAIPLAAAYLTDEIVPDVEERRLERKNLEIGSGSMFYFTVPNGARRAMRATIRVKE
jgi:hypothetical protein